MRLIIVVLLLIIPCLAFTQEIQWSCTPVKDDLSCNGYIINKQEQKILVARNYNTYMKQMSAFKVYSQDLGGIVTGCGSYCTSTDFVNLKTSDLAENYQDVIAVNPAKKVVVTVNLAGILIQPIFNPLEQTQINFNFDPSIAIPAQALKSATFDKSGNLDITYVDEAGEDISKVISVNYNNLGNNPSSAYQWICKEKKCEMFASIRQSKKLAFIANLNSGYSVNWLTPTLAWFQLSCGIHCSDNYFIDYKIGKISTDFYLVYAVNPDQMVVAVPKNDNEDKSILITPIFGNGKNGVTITKNFSSSSFTDVEDDQASFDQNGNLVLNYFTGKDYQLVTEVIPIDYSKLN